MTTPIILSTVSVAISVASAAIAVRAKRDFTKMRREALYAKFLNDCDSGILRDISDRVAEDMSKDAMEGDLHDVKIPKSISEKIAENINREITNGASWAKSTF